MPRAGMPRAGQQPGRAPGRRPCGGLELWPWEVGWHPLSAGGQWSQDEAMSDGWNHAGRSGAEHPPAGGWAAVAGSFSCFWDGQQKKTEKASHRDPERMQADVGRRQTQSMCVGKGDREKVCERFRIRQTNTESRREWNHSERTERFRVEPHNPDLDRRVLQRETDPGGRQTDHSGGGR